MAEGKLNIYNLGDVGVRLNDSPIHVPDGSLTEAQNTQISQQSGEHAIRKRPGLTKLTDTAAAGRILAMANLPFADPLEDAYGGLGSTMEYGIDSVSGTSRRSSDGTTWAYASSIAAADLPQPAANGRTHQGGYIYGGVLYYPHTDGSLRQYDGVHSGVHSTPPSTLGGLPYSAIHSIVGSGSTLYALVAYTSDSIRFKYAVYSCTLTGGTWTQQAESFDTQNTVASGVREAQNVDGLTYWNSKLWVIVHGTDAARPITDDNIVVLSITPGDTSWATDRTVTTSFGILGTILGGGNVLWIAYSLSSGSPSNKLDKRTTGGVWSTVLTASAQILPLYALGDRLYVNDSAVIKRSTNAGTSFTSFSLSPSPSAGSSGVRGFVLGSTYYLVLTSYGVVKDDGVTPTLVDAAFPLAAGALL